MADAAALRNTGQYDFGMAVLSSTTPSIDRVSAFRAGAKPCDCSDATSTPAAAGITQRNGMDSPNSCRPVARPPPKPKFCGQKGEADR